MGIVIHTNISIVINGDTHVSFILWDNNGIIMG